MVDRRRNANVRIVLAEATLFRRTDGACWTEAVTYLLKYLRNGRHLRSIQSVRVRVIHAGHALYHANGSSRQTPLAGSEIHAEYT